MMPLRARLINPPQQIPALLVDVPGRDAWLLDCGYVYAVRFRDLLRVQAVLVSHMHINHFAGFDHVVRIRVNAGHEAPPLAVYGPVGIRECVQHKLRGYTWNLATPHLHITVHEVGEDRIERTYLDPAAAFEAQPRPAADRNGSLLETPDVKIDVAVVDHQVPCLGFAVQQRALPALRKERLAQRGLSPGPWIERLKHMAAGIDTATDTIDVDGRPHRVADLAADLLEAKHGMKIAYLTDTIYNKRTVPRMLELIAGADAFFCGAPFLTRDRDPARETYHLTARQAANLAKDGGVKALHLFHLSRRYNQEPEALFDEAREVFPALAPPPAYDESGDA